MTKNRRHDIVKPSKYKTSICTFFCSEEGCPFGEKCAFAHGEDELRSDPKATAPLPEAATAVPATPARDTLSTPNPPRLKHVDSKTAVENGQRKDAPAHQLQREPPVTTTTLVGAKRRTKKGSCDSSSLVPGNMRTFPGGGPGDDSTSAARGDAPVPRGRAVLSSRDQRRPRSRPPPPGHGMIPPPAFGFAVPLSTPASFGIPDDLSGLACGGVPAMMAGMPYYIPTMGHYPFSVINNNQHAINVAPAMHSSVPYTTLPCTGQLLAPPPPPPTLPSATVASSSASTDMTGSGSSAAVAAASPGEGAKRRQLQPAGNVVSSNTMAHRSSRHVTNESSTVPCERATPQYVHSLMATSGGFQSASPPPGNNDPPNTDVEQNAQPRLIVVPNSSDSCRYTVPTTVTSYPHAGPQSVFAIGGAAVAPSLQRSTASMSEGSGSDLHNPLPAPVTNSSNSASAEHPHPSNFVAAAPALAAAVEHPSSNSVNNGQGGGMSIGDSLWGPTEGSVCPITPSLASRTTTATLSNERHSVSTGNYDAILSGLGIGGSSYTTIPLDSLMRQRSTALSEDDATLGGDLDWTGAVERWLQAAREDGMMAGTTTPSADGTLHSGATAVPKAVAAATASPAEETPTAAKSSAAAAAVTTKTHHPQSVGCVMAALKSDPFLVAGETAGKAVSTLSPVKEAKRRTAAAVCQVSKGAVDKPVKSQRRAPVTVNHFKSSCAAEAGSGSVLLYCAEKNTLVYITSGGCATSVAVTPRGHDGEAALPTGISSVAPSQRDVMSPIASAASVPDTSSNIPNTASSIVGLGVCVRFVPGRKKRSVLEVVSDDDAEYCI
ncbi:hypothetical protein JKF63_06054 [Porcisia hertigi]|uniref:C3H1-type domain-containing protein n=1 Tax=Porcisia hertigi TaxID=2761500 RepID=A0A836LE98_9TRYP|nr:hypothetical protein JKF63_06054 [Porcisia hertigi]